MSADVGTFAENSLVITTYMNKLFVYQLEHALVVMQLLPYLVQLIRLDTLKFRCSDI